MIPVEPFAHDSCPHLCAACGAPALAGIDCFCVDFTTDLPPCSGCGAAPGDYEATCPVCREEGRVDLVLSQFFDRQLSSPPDELRAEEPLPTVTPPSRRSWRPVAA